MARVLAAAPASNGRVGLAGLWPFGPIRRPAAALVAAMVLGIVVGVTEPGITPFAAEESWSETPDVDDLAFGDDLDWDDQT